MVDVKDTKIKLVDRVCRIVVEATGAQSSQTESVLTQTDF